MKIRNEILFAAVDSGFIKRIASADLPVKYSWPILKNLRKIDAKYTELAELRREIFARWDGDENIKDRRQALDELFDDTTEVDFEPIPVSVLLEDENLVIKPSEIQTFSFMISTEEEDGG